MSGRETSMGGSREGFPDTAWSVLGDPALPPEQRRAALDRLCTRYWRPVYAFIRVARRASIEDAKDLAQDFFRHVLEDDVVFRYEPARGRFRHFLKGSLKHFLANARREAGAQKRGGDAVILSIEGDAAGRNGFEIGGKDEDPDALFDRQWVREIMVRGVDRLRATYEEEGHPVYFRVYESQDLCPAGAEQPSYEETGRLLGIKADDVRNFLRQARARLQQIIVKSISEYSTSPEELKEELRELFRR